MARDLPEYQRSQGITPQANPQGFDTAVTAAQTGMGVIGKLGRQLAQDSSNELARLSGLEAGKTPGRTVLPPLTESDKHFVDSYKAQEYSTVLNNTTQHIKNLYTKAIRKPDQHSALHFMALSQQSISDATANLTLENQTRLKQDLQGVYLTAQGDLDDKVYGHGQKTQKDNFVNDLNTFLRLVNTVGATNTEEATRLTNDYVEKLESYNGLFDGPQLNDFKRLIIDNLGTTYKIKSAKDLIREGKMEGKLKELDKLPATPDNLDTAEVYRNIYNNHQAMIAAQENIVFTQYTQKRIEGKLTESDTAYLKQNLSPLNFAQFELDTAKWMLQKKEKADLYDFYSKNKNNILALSDLTPSQLDEAFDTNLKRISDETGRPVDFEMQAQLAKDIPVPVPAFNKRLNNLISSDNGAAAALGAQVYGQLSLNYPRSVSGVSAENGQRAETLNRLLNTEVPIEDAMKSVNKMYDNLSATQVKEREQLYGILTKDDSDLKNLEKQKKFLAESLGLNSWFGDNLALPDGVALEFMDLLKANYIKSGNMKDAKADAAKRINAVYQKTSINGREQLMRNAPTRWMNDNEARVQLDSQVRELFHETNTDFDMNDISDSLFKYKLLNKDLKDAKTPEEILSAVGIDREIKVERIDALGNKTVGVIQVEPDKYSEFMPPGINASYGIYFKADGDYKISPIYDAKKGYSNARFDITVEGTMKKHAAQKAMRDINNKERDEHVKSVMELERKVRDMRLEAGEDLYGYP